MTDVETSEENVIFFDVIDNNDLSYYFDTKTRKITVEVKEPACTVRVSSNAYENLLHGKSSFEIEVSKGELKVLGNYLLLKEFGNAIRLNS